MFINLILSHINYADFKHETDAKFKDIEFLDSAVFPENQYIKKKLLIGCAFGAYRTVIPNIC
jgi:hypothetical protein